MAKNLFSARFWFIWPKILATSFFFVFKNLAPSVTRYHGQLSSCTISETANDPILKNLSDGRTDEQADRPTDGRE